MPREVGVDFHPRSMTVLNDTMLFAEHDLHIIQVFPPEHNRKGFRGISRYVADGGLGVREWVDDNRRYGKGIIKAGGEYVIALVDELIRTPSEGFSHILRSSDGGTTWTRVCECWGTQFPPVDEFGFVLHPDISSGDISNAEWARSLPTVF